MKLMIKWRRTTNRQRQLAKEMVDRKFGSIRLLVCSSCTGVRERATELQALQKAFAAQGLEKTTLIEFGGCLNGCAKPIAIGLQGEMRASYVFSGIDLLNDAEDIVRTCKAYQDAPKGWIVNAHDCGRLRHCLLARLPSWRL